MGHFLPRIWLSTIGLIWLGITFQGQHYKALAYQGDISMMFLVGQLARVHLCRKHCFEVLRVVELFEARTTKRKVRKSSLEMTKVVLCTTKNVSLEQVKNASLLGIGYVLKSHVFPKMYL
jgi:hypothetical protein